MKKRGYLLIEMVVALAMILMVLHIVAGIQVQIAAWHHEATQYMIATTLAQRVLIGLQQKIPWHHTVQGFEITVHSYTVQPTISCMMHEITISFQTSRGTKEVVITGGSLQ